MNAVGPELQPRGLRRAAAAICWPTPGRGLSTLTLNDLTAQLTPHSTRTSLAPGHGRAELLLHLSLLKSKIEQEKDPCPLSQATLCSCVFGTAADLLAGCAPAFSTWPLTLQMLAPQLSTA